MKKEKSAAILTVFDIGQMTDRGRKAVLTWLKNQIRNIEKYHTKPGFASRYTARYIY